MALHLEKLMYRFPKNADIAILFAKFKTYYQACPLKSLYEKMKIEKKFKNMNLFQEYEIF